MVKIIKKQSENLPDFDYENGIVEVRDHTMQDEDIAEKAAKIEFGNGRKDFEPSTRQFLASLFKRISKFYKTEEDYREKKECGFKAGQILQMPSPFLTECFQMLNPTAQLEEEENGN